MKKYDCEYVFFAIMIFNKKILLHVLVYDATHHHPQAQFSGHENHTCMLNPKNGKKKTKSLLIKDGNQKKRKKNDHTVLTTHRFFANAVKAGWNIRG